MEDLLYSILNLLTTSPGNLVYHLVVGFSVIAALQAVILDRRAESDSTRSRTILGLSLLVLSQFGEFIATGLAWQGMADMHFFLPPLDRAIIAFSLLILVWLWVFPKSIRVGDFLVTLLVFAALISFLVTLASWNNQASTIPFNGSLFDQYWIGSTGLVVAIGLLGLVVRRPAGWGIGFAVLAVNLLGLAAHFFWYDPSADFAGAVRLAQMCTFPLLPTLILRLKQPDQAPSPEPAKSGAPVFKERRKHSADPRTVLAWLQVAANQEPGVLPSRIARAVAQTMFADLCFLVTSPVPHNHLTLVGGYDLIREQSLPPVQIERERVSILVNAIVRGRSLHLGGEAGDSPDLANLAREIGLDDCGGVCLIPLGNVGQTWGAILLLSPYSDRTWTQDDQTYLSSSLENITSLLTASMPEPVQPAADAGQPGAVMEEMLHQLEILRQENQLLLNEISIMRQNGPETHPIDLILAQGSTQQAAASNQVEQLEAQLRHTQEEFAHLQNLLADADQKTQKHSTTGNNEEVISIVQELRQPLASLTGYTDLILSESAGILGGLQRKFMEHIRISTERMQAMIDEIIQVAADNADRSGRTAEPVLVGEVIDSVITENRTQVQEKNITFHIDFPETLPQLNIERDAFEQIVACLVQNAILASPYEGSIFMRCSIEAPASSTPCFLFQVTDYGGGVEPADLSQVFSKRIKAEIPLILGIGDRGMGLSIAKTLVEAHLGRIWVESEQGKSTTFSVLLPLLSNAGMA